MVKQESLPSGACPICKLQYVGRVHICPGPITHNTLNALIGSQALEEDMPRAPRPRRYGERLAAGFAMLKEGGW